MMTTQASSDIGPAPLTPEPGTRRSDLGRELVEQLKRHGLTGTLAGVSVAWLFAVWYLGTKYELDFYIRFKNIPTPHDVWRLAGEVVGSDTYLINISNSIRRILVGFAFATGLGVTLGLLIGKYRRVNQLFMPALEVLRPIPAIAWVPMSIMLWPNNEASIVFITFIGAFFPILLNTTHGVHEVDRVLLNAGRCLGASELQLFAYIILPGVLPSVFTGLSIGMGVAWVSLIAAEMISGNFGVGYYTWEAYSLVNYPAIVVGMLTIGILGLVCSGAIRWLGKLVMPWQAYVNGETK
jgi:NitT/TauT family transport system permease protein